MRLFGSRKQPTVSHSLLMHSLPLTGIHGDFDHNELLALRKSRNLPGAQAGLRHDE